MGTQSCVTDRITPIDQPLLRVIVHGFEARRNLRQRGGIARHAIEQITCQVIVRIMRPDTPIATTMIAAHIGVDELAFA